MRKAIMLRGGNSMRFAARSILMAMFLASAGAAAGPLEDAWEAYSHGDFATALRLWRPLANQGNAGAQNNLGLMYNDGTGVPRDIAEAAKWFRRAADQGNAEAQYHLGGMYADGTDVPQDYPEAVKWYRKAADQGDAFAQTNLGDFYAVGKGVARDYAKALKWYRLAADQGSALAQSKIGGFYGEGTGVAQDYAEALKWYRRAADRTQNHLGLMYQSGGVATDPGFAIAQNHLGYMYQHGQGVAQDYAEALKWYRLAADQGSVDAWLNLGQMYEDGLGVPRDHAESLKFYRKAADQGSAAALLYLAALRDQDSARLSNSNSTNVPLQKEGGTFLVPVSINGALTLKFLIDSGASDVSIPADVVMTLIRTGTLDDADFLGSQTYKLADGSTVPSQTFRIRSLKVGDRVLENVMGSVAPVAGSLLLGQSFLSRFKSWSIDNQRQTLVLD